MDRLHIACFATFPERGSPPLQQAPPGTQIQGLRALGCFYSYAARGSDTPPAEAQGRGLEPGPHAGAARRLLMEGHPDPPPMPTSSSDTSRRRPVGVAIQQVEDDPLAEPPLA